MFFFFYESQIISFCKKIKAYSERANISAKIRCYNCIQYRLHCYWYDSTAPFCKKMTFSLVEYKNNVMQIVLWPRKWYCVLYRSSKNYIRYLIPTILFGIAFHKRYTWRYWISNIFMYKQIMVRVLVFGHLKFPNRNDTKWWN